MSRLVGDGSAVPLGARPARSAAGGARRRMEGDSGVALALIALLMTGVLVMVALVVDLGFVRGSTRVEQSVADMAALATGNGLAAKNPTRACLDAIAYVNANARDMPAINSSSFCTQTGNSVTSTVCSGGALAQAKPTATSGRYKVSVHYPVPDSEIDDPKISGAGLNDKAPCDRMRVIISATDPSFFGGVVGTDSYTTTRSATAVSVPGFVRRIPALWLLDPRGCTSLDVSGGSTVEVGTSTVNGVIMVDSDGSKCTGQQATVDVAGGSKVWARNGTTTGYIGLYALPPGDTVCSVPACDPADVTSVPMLLEPMPQTLSTRATRQPVDWRYNCKSSYGNFPVLQTGPDNNAFALAPCPDTGARGNYIDKLNTTFATAGFNGTKPAGYTMISGADCSPSGLVTHPAGNYWVNCNSFSIGNGTHVSFAGGNVVFTGDIKMTGGSVTLNATYNPTTGLYSNTSNPATNLTGLCLNPGTGSPCVTSSSRNAAFVYFTDGGLNFTGGNFYANRTSVIMKPAGGVKVTGGSPPRWTSPAEGPFAQLSLWAEGVSGPFQINGGSGVELSGAFFTPEGTMTLSGGGDWAVPQNAQFISYKLKVTGGGILRLAPDPNTAISAPPQVARLIR